MKTIIIAVRFIIITFVSYLIFSFVKSTFDITLWTEEQRSGLVVISLVATTAWTLMDELG